MQSLKCTTHLAGFESLASGGAAYHGKLLLVESLVTMLGVLAL